jgi:hypothetical protein
MIGNPILFKTIMLNAKEKEEHRPALEVKAAEANVPQLIAQLDELRKRGILTDEEFSEKKVELLAKLS